MNQLQILADKQGSIWGEGMFAIDKYSGIEAVLTGINHKDWQSEWSSGYQKH